MTSRGVDEWDEQTVPSTPDSKRKRCEPETQPGQGAALLGAGN